MSILGVLATLSLLSGSAFAQISAASCTFTEIYDWTFNSLNQSPCTIAAYLQSTCNSGSFTIPALLSGQEYLGPSGTDNSDLCKCNTVVYSLISACGACQSAIWIDWPQWAHNCTTVLSPGSFPNPVPQGTRIPQWALADVTRQDLALWDSIEAMAIGDTPEIGPGALIGSNSSASGPGPTGTNTANPTNFPAFTTPFPTGSSLPTSGDSPDSGSSKKKSSKTAAIIGGAAGGAVVIAIAVIIIGLLSRRRRPTPPPGPYMTDISSQPLYDAQKPMSDIGTTAPPSTVETPVMPMRVYDPNDATTFPGYQEPQPVPDMPAQPPFQPDMPAQPPFQPYNPPGNLMANNMQPTMPHGYSGLPTV